LHCCLKCCINGIKMNLTVDSRAWCPQLLVLSPFLCHQVIVCLDIPLLWLCVCARVLYFSMTFSLVFLSSFFSSSFLFFKFIFHRILHLKWLKSRNFFLWKTSLYFNWKLTPPPLLSVSCHSRGKISDNISKKQAHYFIYLFVCLFVLLVLSLFFFYFSDSFENRTSKFSEAVLLL